MFSGIKRALINFGVDIIVDNAYQLLIDNTVHLVTYLADLSIRRLNSLDMNALKSMGVIEEDALLLKERGVSLLRAVLLVVVNAITRNSLKLKEALYEVLKIKL